MTTTIPPERSTSTVAKQAIPALVIGVGSALALAGVSAVADELEHFLWDWLPESFGTTGDNRWWIFGVLTLVGIVVGLVVWKVPGHAGPDPATEGLVAEPLPISVLPSLALALIVCLAGGVSLGPENPIIGINVALAVWLLSRLLPNVPPQFGLLLAVSATVGAMFGTPVAAALLLTEMKQMHARGQLWDNLFAPVAAAGAGALTMTLIGSPMLAIDLPPMSSPGWRDLVFGVLIGVAAALLGLVVLYLFDPLHGVLHRLPNPLITLTVGGLILGALGAIGGEVTLFKGLNQMETLAHSDYTIAGLILIAAVKIAALLVSATAGFRGGRIFPSVFVGLAIGEVAHAMDTDIPIALAAGCGILGFVLVVARDGWLALFVAVAMIGEIQLLPLLCIVMLPVWLIVSSRPDMVATPVPANNRPKLSTWR